MGKSDLLWGIIARRNAFTIHNRISNENSTLSRDPFSVKSQHSFANSGLIDTKAVAIETAGKGGLKITVKRTRRFKNNTAKGMRPYNFSTTVMRGSQAAKVNFRPDHLVFQMLQVRPQKGQPPPQGQLQDRRR